MGCVTGLPVSKNWKIETYNSIFVIADCPTRTVYYEPVKVTIDAPDLAEVIIDMVIWPQGLPHLIISDQRPVFNLKFWSLLYYFLGIEQRLLTAFRPKTHG